MWSSKKIIITLNIQPSITYTYEVVVTFNKKEQIIHIQALNKLEGSSSAAYIFVLIDELEKLFKYLFINV